MQHLYVATIDDEYRTLPVPRLNFLFFYLMPFCVNDNKGVIKMTAITRYRLESVKVILCSQMRKIY